MTTRAIRRLAAGLLVLVAALVPVVGFAATAVPSAGQRCVAGQFGRVVAGRTGRLLCARTPTGLRWIAAPAGLGSAPVASTTALPTTALPTTSAAPSTTRPGTTLRIGFLDAAFHDARGRVPPSTGDAARQIGALVDAVNASGGIGGKRVEAVVEPFDLGVVDDAQVRALCASFAGKGVVAVVDQGVIVSPSARACFAERRIMYVAAGGSFPLDAATLERMGTYAWAIAPPSVERLGKPYARMLLAERFFGTDTSAARVGVVAMGDAAYRHAAEEVRSTLADGGVNAQVVFVDTASQDTVNRDAAAAARRFASGGLTHVVSLLSGANVLPFLWSAEDLRFAPRMALTSLDNLRAVQNAAALKLRPVSRAALTGALAMGFQPATDTDDAQLAYPQLGGESSCASVLRQGQAVGGLTSRFALRHALAYCDGLAFLRAAASGAAGPVDASALAAGAAKLGTSFLAAGSWRTSFADARHDGADGYRVLRFDTTCTAAPSGCFAYAGGVRALN